MVQTTSFIFYWCILQSNIYSQGTIFFPSELVLYSTVYIVSGAKTYEITAY